METVKFYTAEELAEMSKTAEIVRNEFEQVRDARVADVNEGRMTAERYKETIEEVQMPLYRKSEKLNKEYREALTQWAPKVGEGATVHFYSDSHACTIVKVSKSGKTFTIREDKATLDPNFKCETVPGGFMGHTINNNAQTYTYEPNENGREYRVSWTKRGWTSKGKRISSGRSEFYDYNF